MTLKNTSGLSFEFLENGAVRSIDAGPIRISLKAASAFSNPGTNLYLRKRAFPFEFTVLMGPASNSLFHCGESVFQAKGSWSGIDYACTLRLSDKSPGWQWTVEISNTSAETDEFDLIYVQDIGLKAAISGPVNEYYVSQYLERRILEDQNFGAVVCCRQNMKESTGHPWLMLACTSGAMAASTDGMQFYGKAFRETGIPEGLMTEKAGGEYSGESSVIALQEKPFKLAPGDHHHSVFIASYMPDHALATSEDDLKRLPGLIHEFESGSPILSDPAAFQIPSGNLFNSASFLPVDDLSEEELNRYFGKERRHSEMENGRLLSFFCQENNHVVLKSKEILADRPHAHIMQAKAGFAPDENIMSTTSFAFGVFNSHISQGNTNFNVLLSVCTSQFNLSPEAGQRIILTIDDRPYLLGVPSAFEMGLNHCRWIYKHGGYCFQVRTWTSKNAPQVNLDFKVLSGKPVNLLTTLDFDPLNGWRIFPGKVIFESVALPDAGSMIATKFPDARFRMIVQGETAGFKMRNGDREMASLFTIDISKTPGFCMSFLGEVTSLAEPVRFKDPDDQFDSDCRDARSAWQDLSLNLSLQGNQEDIASIREILPWYGMNALTHFLTPYGLEQFSGAAWGTRDVSQGPVDLLLTMAKFDEARQVLLTIFSNQNPEGGWPQWWMFDSYREIRAHDSHGDVYYWCLIALSNYIKVTGDVKILDVILPYYHENGPAGAEKTPLSEHVDRLIGMIVDSFHPGTALIPFGGGDWNDSLQPVSSELAQRMISSWTVEMNYEAFFRYKEIFMLKGQQEKAEELIRICEQIKTDFNKYLVKDGMVAGYGLVENDRSISVLLHPGDSKTGIRYSLLPMERGINSGIFTREQAEHHQELIEKHLKGPDGARLMDRPIKYQGGIQEIFQRAESSTFFGREIGLMYVHEHIRYAESLARLGRADAFVKALRQAIPIGYRDIVPCGDIRQSNCYYSSSDVHFKSRYEADERYDEIITGNLTLKGGWRVYSSGPGIYIGLVVSRLLGLRVELGQVIIDPVLPESFDGMSVSMDFLDHRVTFKYFVQDSNFSPKSIIINGKAIDFILELNSYRKGGAVIPKSPFLALLDQKDNTVQIRL